jgi:hypothetical protein
MTNRTPFTGQALRLSAVFMLGLFAAAPASAQIIVTMVPRPRPILAAGPGEFEWPSGAHVFGGYSGWDFNNTTSDFEVEPKTRHGYLFAADYGKRVSEAITVGAGGWYNGTNAYTVDGWSDPTDPFLRSDIQHRFKRSSYSIYGSLYYKVVGIQAGIVPVSVTQTTITKASGASVTDDDGGQVDATVFGVVRLGASEADTAKISLAAGFGVQRFGARDANAGTGTVAASPSSLVPTGFGTFTFHIHRRLSADMSFWYTYGDEAGGFRDIGNRYQFRGSFGMGYQF